MCEQAVAEQDNISRDRFGGDTTESERPCPELALLLTCLAADPSPSLLNELLKQDISWKLLVEMAGWHGVIPLLAHRLAGRADAVPPQIVQLMRGFALTNASKNLSLSVELTQLSAAMASRGISAIPYKGTLLSEYLYGSAALRSVYDIDLIVRREDVFRAMECLEEIGFEDGFGLTASQRANAVRYGFEHAFVRGDTTVDLHWRVVPGFAWPSLDAENFWSDLVPFQFCGSELQIFAPEWMLTALCIHAAQHDWMQLKMLADIAQLLKQHRLDWQRIEKLTGDSHSRRSLLVALCLTHEYLDAPLPAGASEAIDQDPHVRETARWVFMRFWPCAKDPTTDHMNLSWLLFRTRGERWIDRCRYICGFVFGPTMADFWSVRLPNAFAWMYFATRPLRIISERVRRSAKPS